MPSGEQPDRVPNLKEASAQFLRLLGMMRPYWVPLGKGLSLGIVTGVIGMTLPYLTKLLIDRVYPAEDVTLMHVLVGGLLAISVSSTLLGALRGYYTMMVTAELTNATTLLFFNHLQHLTIRFFDRHRVGEIMSRFQDVGRSLTAVSNALETLLVNGVYLVLVPPFLFLLEWKLAVVALIAVPLTVLITGLSGRLLRKFWKETSEAYADLGAIQVESLSHVRTLKSAAIEHSVFVRMRGQLRKALELQLRAGGFARVLGAMNGIVGALNTALFTWYGWTLILTGEMTLGTYIAFTAYVGYLHGPLNRAVGLFSDFQQSAVHLGRMFEYLDTPTEQDPELAYHPPRPIQRRIAGHIELASVSFSYQPPNPTLLEIDLEARPGQATAIVGRSGSGKSTILRLLCRMVDPDSGVIRVDGFPLTEIPLPDLRRQLAVVWQEPGVLQGTLWENLTFGSEEADPATVDAVVRLCQLEGFVAELPEGYATPVGEWGATLSGGQRQRVALARTLIRDTPVILLDEATSNMDPETELDIVRELLPRLRERTLLFVTHRPTTAALADHIVVVEAGRVVASGTHEELIGACAPYRRMHRSEPPEPPRRPRVLAR